MSGQGGRASPFGTPGASDDLADPVVVPRGHRRLPLRLSGGEHLQHGPSGCLEGVGARGGIRPFYAHHEGQNALGGVDGRRMLGRHDGEDNRAVT